LHTHKTPCPTREEARNRPDVKVDLQLNNLPTTAKRKTKAAPLCANRESGKHIAFANHAPIHLNSTMIHLLFQGGFIYVQDQNQKAQEHLFL
ncbi:hypothetical protein, partial [Selenomonas noxia]|uniref:hypothetical protein n=1 Tax=Selenomonas noxia TaxID=135083 RepID=UPI0023F38F64